MTPLKFAKRQVYPRIIATRSLFVFLAARILIIFSRLVLDLILFIRWQRLLLRAFAGSLDLDLLLEDGLLGSRWLMHDLLGALVHLGYQREPLRLLLLYGRHDGHIQLHVATAALLVLLERRIAYLTFLLRLLIPALHFVILFLF